MFRPFPPCRCLLPLPLLAAFVLISFAPARADLTAAPAADPAKTEAETPPPEVPAEMRSPREVLETFVTRMRADEKSDAAKLLNLSGLSAVAAGSRGADLAYKLYRLAPVLGDPPNKGDGEDLAFWESPSTELDFSKAPDDPDYPEPWPLSEWLKYPKPEAQAITIARDEQKHWRFSAETVAQIDTLYEQLEPQIEELADRRAATAPPGEAEAVGEPTATTGHWLRQQFPQSWRTTHFLLPSYQWLLLLLLLPLGRIAELLTRTVLTTIGDRVLHRIDPDVDDVNDSTVKVWRPVGRLVHAAVWALGARMIELPSDVTSILLTVLVIVTIIAAVLALFRVIELVAGYFARRAKRSNRRFDDLFIPLATSTAKILIGLAGVVATVAVFNDKLPATLIGGLGIGGIAIALASQETLSNFVGSITLLFDRPFEVGDYVKIDTVEGSVESLGFRSTRIRTPLDSEVTLPNSKLASSSVDNWGRRKYRRYLSKLGLEYGTSPERIEAFCEGIRELIRRHPHTRKDFYAAYFNDFGPSSLDVLLVVFFDVPDWPTELRERHRLLADILRLAESVGVAFAFPTQTLHLQRDAGPEAPPELADPDPDTAGARAAAQIAGELANYQDRPGRVKFPGPTPLD
ncbi:Low conductance mechanosensitive channel YnaI [Botrimarina colliarenosi]|uniref:Low conductance mechanosensitive channel YnaI n=1 Tax=Botrimarina colliarenosi TaxID=2528001 RepID=A0A5C6AQR6_9BACT|nr:mechanosensitive ion channel domain-containing protein [Botrimarina colliarenosi]TWU00534.1 Low conductance mechanosensitive channel YnaI [Botrimarina colliarenosi]